MMRAHSDVLLLVHVVWSTIDRRPILSASDDAWLAGGVRSACARLIADCIAVGNADDHVHVVVSMHPSTSIADLAQRLKGTTSHAWNRRGGAPELHWQAGYWARNVDPSHLAPLVDYVREQRSRHRSHAARADWEQTPAVEESP